MLWEHERQASVSTAFSSSPKLSQVFLLLDRNTVHVFLISFRTENNIKEETSIICYFKNIQQEKKVLSIRLTCSLIFKEETPTMCVLKNIQQGKKVLLIRQTRCLIQQVTN